MPIKFPVCCKSFLARVFCLGVSLLLGNSAIAQDSNPPSSEPQPAAAGQVQEPQRPPPADQKVDNNPAAQMSEMELMERVEVLQRQLASQQIPERDAAEKELIQCGPIVLDLLEVSENESSSDMTTRLGRIRKALEKAAAEAVTRPSLVSISGNFSIEDIFKKIKQQTHNDVGLVEDIPNQLADQTIDLDLKATEFWPAMKEIMEQSGLEISPYASAPGQLRLAPKSVAVDENGAPLPPSKIRIPNDQAGIFDFQVTRIDATRNLITPQNSYSNLYLKIRWEPRIRPISVVLPLQHVTAIDEFDKPINVANEEAVVAAIVQPEIPELEFNVPLQLVDRRIEEIKVFEVEIDTILPGRIEMFKFKNLGNLAVDTEQTKAGVIVSFGGISKNEDLFGVQLNIGFDDDSEATESYQGWLFQNEVFLLDSDGNPHEYVGMESGVQRDNRTGVLYYFDVDPAQCTLVYKTPAAIVKMPIKIKLEKIPLP